MRKKKKKGKREINKKKQKLNNSFDNKNDEKEDSDFSYRNDRNDIKNKTISKFPNAYQKFQINSVNQLKQKLNLRRLVIITNLGNTNLDKPSIYINNNNLKNIPNN